MMLATGFGALAAMIPVPKAGAAPLGTSPPDARPPPPPARAGCGRPGRTCSTTSSTARPARRRTGRSGSVSNFRTPIKNPVNWDRPEFFGQYRDSRQNVFLDGKSNLVLRATREGARDGDAYFGGLVSGTWRGGIGTTWEARIKLNCLRGPACGPHGGCPTTIPVAAARSICSSGTASWPSGTTVHANPDGTAFETHPIGMDGGLAQLASYVEPQRHVFLGRL